MVKPPFIGLLATLIAVNLGAWAWALAVFGSSGVMIGMAMLAYTFGLRHGVDADHIAAIDNVTRKLIQERKRSWDVGLYFSLGHSTVVVALSVTVAMVAGLVSEMGAVKAVGGIIGTVLSASFLFAIAGANIGVLNDAWTRFRRVRNGGALEGCEPALVGGPWARMMGRAFCLISHGWQMYPLGFLFGLGFDTATEVGLLGLSAAQSLGGDLGRLLVFPALFTAAMSLVDTLDSMVMTGAYRWAFVKPVRKLYYNLTITFVSVLMAVLVGGLEVLGLLVDRFGLVGRFWTLIAGINDHFEIIGFGMVGLFIACWSLSILIYRINKYDELEPAAD